MRRNETKPEGGAEASASCKMKPWESTRSFHVFLMIKITNVLPRRLQSVVNYDPRFGSSIECKVIDEKIQVTLKRAVL